MEKREIKFRVWSEYDGKLHYADASHFMSFNDDGSLNTASGFGLDNIAEQYTGLKDKNGVEIYEGDIVALDKVSKWVIEYKANAFVGTPFITNKGLELLDLENKNYFQYEVVSSIHENPEKLNSNKAEH